MDIFSCVPSMLNRACQKLLVNLGSRSETMDDGNPCSLYIVFKNISAVSGAVAFVCVAAKWACLLRRSTKTTIASLPFLDLGKDVIKSIETESQDLVGIGSGCRAP